jgi:O-methyltransferase
MSPLRPNGHGQTHMASETSIPVETREIQAPGPGADAASLRTAYLELLKLSLCDLVGARTMSVGRTGSGRVFVRELAGELLKLRSAGLDWPLTGLSMVGLRRLDDLQACVETVVADGVEGDLIEAGAWRGGASILVRATLDSLGATDRCLYVADSFGGFPAPDTENFPVDAERDLHTVDFLAVGLEEVSGHFSRLGVSDGVEFVPGLFQDTMASLAGHRWSLVRLDGDTYESTWLTLEALYPGLSEGGFLLVDDYKLIDECRRAVDDYRAQHGIEDPIEEVDWNGVRWRRSESGPHATSEPAPATLVRTAMPATELPAAEEIPSLEEIRLSAEVKRLRAELEPAEKRATPGILIGRLRRRLQRDRGAG